MNKTAHQILVTGGLGLVGTDLVARLRQLHTDDSVIVSDLNPVSSQSPANYESVDVRDKSQLEKVLNKYQVTEVYHLAGLLSVGGEKNPQLAWDVNVNGLKNVLDLGVKYNFRVFWPSSIAAFGPTTPKIYTPQNTVLEPTTIYGVTKVTGELLCQYYFRRYGLDVRSLRFPGLIAWKAPPGDGTTEYSVHIFYAALKDNHYTCFLKADSVLPMMYIDDAISGVINLMQVPDTHISVRTSYNFSGISFAPRDLVAEIAKVRPGFTCDYLPDSRQDIADSWPRTIDDSVARTDWNWSPKTDLKELVRIMLANLTAKI